jgi:hypothetical protein
MGNWDIEMVKVCLSGAQFEALPARTRGILNEWKVSVRTEGLTFLLPRKVLREAHVSLEGMKC